MARGMANGEPVVSQAATDEFRAEHDRIFGDKPPERGRWVWDAQSKCLVRAEDYVPPSRAVDAPIMAGRFYETMQTVDGADITSRAKHRAYCTEKGVTPATDFSDKWYQSVRDGRKREAKKSRREVLERAFYEIDTGKR